MELYERILCQTIAREVIPSLNLDGAQLLELKCYQAIKKIYETLSNERLDDEACFQRIEEVISVLDELGIGGGGRHDFG